MILMQKVETNSLDGSMEYINIVCTPTHGSYRLYYGHMTAHFDQKDKNENDPHHKNDLLRSRLNALHQCCVSVVQR